MLDEIEWYSNCCDAPPVTELYYDELYDAEPLGKCMQCGDKSVFRPDKLENITKEK